MARLNIDFPEDLHDRLKEKSRKMMISRSACARLAIDEFCNEVKDGCRSC